MRSGSGSRHGVRHRSGMSLLILAEPLLLKSSDLSVLNGVQQPAVQFFPKARPLGDGTASSAAIALSASTVRSERHGFRLQPSGPHIIDERVPLCLNPPRLNVLPTGRHQHQKRCRFNRRFDLLGELALTVMLEAFRAKEGADASGNKSLVDIAGCLCIACGPAIAV